MILLIIMLIINFNRIEKNYIIQILIKTFSDEDLSLADLSLVDLCRIFFVKYICSITYL